MTGKQPARRGRKPAPKWPELPAKYQSRRGLKGVDLRIYEALQIRKAKEALTNSSDH